MYLSRREVWRNFQEHARIWVGVWFSVVVDA